MELHNLQNEDFSLVTMTGYTIDVALCFESLLGLAFTPDDNGN